MQTRKNSSFRDIWNFLKKSNKILMGLHPRPDGDSLGSCAAMKYALEGLGKTVRLVSKDKISDGLDSYDFNKEVEYGTDLETVDLENFDCVVFLDHGTLEAYYSEAFREKLKKVKVINIDHHSTNSYYGDMNYVETKASSTCSVLYEFFESCKEKFDRDLSLRLLIGMCTDTAFFIHGNSVDNLKKAAVLLEKGKLDYKKDLYHPIMSNSWKLKKLHGIILKNMVKVEIKGRTVAYGWATKKECEKQGLSEADLRLGIVCMENIKGLDLIFTLIEINGEIKGSFRSLNLDTTLYSTALGGGGHKLASAFIIKTKKMKKVIKKVLRTIAEKGYMHIE